MYNNNNDSNDNKLKSYNYKKNNYIYDNNMDNKLKSNNIDNKLLSSNQPKEKYLIIDTKGDPINIGNKSLYAMKINPLLDENGKEIAAKVTATLKELYADGTVKQLCEKYADYGMSIENWKLK